MNLACHKLPAFLLIIIFIKTLFWRHGINSSKNCVQKYQNNNTNKNVSFYEVISNIININDIRHDWTNRMKFKYPKKIKFACKNQNYFFSFFIQNIREKRSENTLKPENFSYQKAVFSLLYTKTFLIINFFRNFYYSYYF